MSAESYRAAMRAPIYSHNGGASVNGGTGLHYVEEDEDTPPVTAESVQGMAVSGWCWSGAVLSVGAWSVLAWLLLRAFRVL